MLSVCDGCGRLQLRELLLVELEDRWGIWCEWLCQGCWHELLEGLDQNSAVERVALYGFSIDAAG